MRTFSYNTDTKSFADKPKLLYGILVILSDGNVRHRVITGYDRSRLKTTLDKMKETEVLKGSKVRSLIM